MTQYQHESWAGNLVAWIVTGGSWQILGISWPTFLITALTAWWTFEKARTERAKRKYYERNTPGNTPLKTDAGEL